MSGFEIFFVLLAVVFLLFCSAFFSGSETALTAASRARLTFLAEQGCKWAKQVLTLRDKKEHLIGTILIGNNLVNILSTALTTSLLTFLFGPAGILYATIGLTIIVVIFAEILPKTAALQNSEKLAVLVAPIFNVLTKLLRPITWITSKVVNITLHVFGVDSKKDNGDSEEELKGAISLHDDKFEKEMLNGVLTLDDQTVSSVMVPIERMVMVDIDLDDDDFIASVIDSQHTRLPVYQYEKSNIIGIVKTKNLFKMRADADGSFRIRDALQTVTRVNKNKTLTEQLRDFKKTHEHFVIVEDDSKKPIGMATLEDVIEEVVGDIKPQ